VTKFVSACLSVHFTVLATEMVNNYKDKYMKVPYDGPGGLWRGEWRGISGKT